MIRSNNRKMDQEDYVSGEEDDEEKEVGEKGGKKDEWTPSTGLKEISEVTTTKKSEVVGEARNYKRSRSPSKDEHDDDDDETKKQVRLDDDETRGEEEQLEKTQGSKEDKNIRPDGTLEKDESEGGEDDNEEEEYDDGDENEEEEEEHYDEDDDEEKTGRDTSKLRRSRNVFIEEEAEVDEDDDEEEEEGDYPEELDDGKQLKELREEVEASRYRRLDAELRATRFEEEADETATEEYFKRKYGRSYAPRLGGQMIEGGAIPQQSLLPTVRDPKLWLVRCRPGREKDIAFILIRKSFDQVLNILSIVVLGHLKGYMYIEAANLAQVQHALQYAHGILAEKIFLVPIEEMVDVLTAASRGKTGLNSMRSIASLDSGSWVRVKRGKYAGDLAQVVEIDESKNSAVIKLVPRIDITSFSRSDQKLHSRNDGTGKELDKQRSRKTPSIKRAQKKPFNPHELANLGAEIRRSRGFYLLDGDKYRDGFLFKTMSISSLELKKIEPTLDELTQFGESQPIQQTNLSAHVPSRNKARDQEQDDDADYEENGEENDDDDDDVSSRANSQATTKESLQSSEPGTYTGPKVDLNALSHLHLSMMERHQFNKGDLVEVMDGDLQNLMGTVDAVDGDHITVIPRHEELKEPLSFSSNQLRKYFRIGDHVKVIAGNYQGETGLVVSVDQSMVTFFSDVTSQELQVFARDLQISSEVNTSITSTVASIPDSGVKGSSNYSTYELRDLVQIDATTVGIIIGMEYHPKGSIVRALDQNGTSRVIRVSDILGKKRQTAQHFIALDVNQHEIRVGDIVHLLDEKKDVTPRTGTVLHLHRSLAFIHSREISENAGILAVRTKHLAVTRPAFGSTRDGSSITSRGGFSRPPLPQVAAMSRSTGNRDPLRSRTVSICGGPFKGYQGIIVDTTETTARVELHSKNKTITVNKNQLLVQDMRTGVGVPGAAMPVSGFQPTAYGLMTPLQSGLRTPAHGSNDSSGYFPFGSQTPAYGSRTPMHGEGGRTPAWDGSRTPMWHGSETPLPQDHDENWKMPGISEISGEKTINDATSYTNPTNFMKEPPQNSNSSTLKGTTSTPLAPVTDRQTSTRLPYEATATPMSETLRNKADIVESDETTEPWLIESIEVEILPGFQNSSWVGKKAIVVSANQSSPMCTIKLYDDDRTEQQRAGDKKGESQKLHVSTNFIRPMKPGKRDRVRILRGEYRGLTGTLIGIDSGDGIVRLDDNNEFKIIVMDNLGRFVVSNGPFS